VLESVENFRSWIEYFEALWVDMPLTEEASHPTTSMEEQFKLKKLLIHV